MLDKYTFVVPTYALSYLINSDPSGLEQDEQQSIDNWVNSISSQIEKDYPNHRWHFSYNECYEYFAHDNDLDGLGGNVIDLDAIIMK